MSAYVFLYAHDTAANAPKTGDAANITAYVTRDGGAPAAATNAVAEVDATKAPGWYRLQLTQAERDASTVLVTAVSATADVQVEGAVVLSQTIEGAYTLRELVRLMAAALFGKSSGGGSTTITFRDLADGKDRIVATVDSNGNRTAVTLDPS